MTREEAVKFLKSKPYKLGHLVGFKRLTVLNNGWIKDMVCGKGDRTLQAHRLSYKTTCLSIAIPLIMVLRPNCCTMFMRKTDADTAEIIRQIRNVLISDPMRVFVRAIYGVDLVLTVDKADELSTNLADGVRGTSQLVSLGCGGSLTGKHFDYIFTDDIVNIKDRSSRSEREHTKAIYAELQNVVDRTNGGRIFNTGTPWHKDDAFSIMPPAQKFDCYSTGLLTPERVEEIRHDRAMTPSLFAANYELRHIATDGQLFKKSPVYTRDAELLRDGILQIDAAYGGEDSTAITVAVRRGDVIYAYGKKWDQHVDKCLPEIYRISKAFKVSKIICENNADKGYLAQKIYDAGYRAQGYNESMNKYLKISTHLFAWWEQMIWLDTTDPEYLVAIMDYTEDSEHDDCPDSASSAVRYYDK